jgi:hypothetical protein
MPVWPPCAPLTKPPLLINVPLLALEAWKTVIPPVAPLTRPPLLINVPLPAFELLRNAVKPPDPPEAEEALLVKVVEVPAVAPLVKIISPTANGFRRTAVTKFCTIPELFTMPMPLIVRINPGLAVIV